MSAAGASAPPGPLPSPRSVAAVVALLALLACGFVLATRHVVLPWVVVGASMEPTLLQGDRVVVDLWTYRHRAPRPGEIVLFEGPRAGDPPMVKRVVEPPVAGRGAGELWVLGDHRERSLDSRRFGPVPAQRIVGRVAFRYWPLSRAGRVPSTPETESGFRLPDR